MDVRVGFIAHKVGALIQPPVIEGVLYPEDGRLHVVCCRQGKSSSIGSLQGGGTDEKCGMGHDNRKILWTPTAYRRAYQLL